MASDVFFGCWNRWLEFFEQMARSCEVPKVSFSAECFLFMNGGGTRLRDDVAFDMCNPLNVGVQRCEVSVFRLKSEKRTKLKIENPQLKLISFIRRNMVHPDAKRQRISQSTTPFDSIPDDVIWLIFVYLYASAERDNHSDSLFWVDAGTSCPHNYADSLSLMRSQFAQISKSALSLYYRFIKHAYLTVNMTYSPLDFSLKAQKPQWLQKRNIKVSRLIISTGCGDFNQTFRNTLQSLDFSNLVSVEFYSLRTRRYSMHMLDDDCTSTVISSDDLQSTIANRLKSVNVKKLHMTCSPYDLHIPMLFSFSCLQYLSICFICPVFDQRERSNSNIECNEKNVAALNNAIANMKMIRELKIKSSFAAELKVASSSLKELSIDVTSEYHFGNLQYTRSNIILCQCDCPNLRKLLFYDRTGNGRTVQSLRNMNTPMLEDLVLEECCFLSVSSTQRDLFQDQDLNTFTKWVESLVKLRTLRLCLLKRTSHNALSIFSSSVQTVDLRLWRYSQRREESYEWMQFVFPQLKNMYCDIIMEHLDHNKNIQLFGVKMKYSLPFETVSKYMLVDDRQDKTWIVPLQLGDNPIDGLDAPSSCTILANFHEDDSSW